MRSCGRAPSSQTILLLALVAAIAMVPGSAPVHAFRPATGLPPKVQTFHDRLVELPREDAIRSLELEFPLLLNIGLMKGQSEVSFTSNKPFYMRVDDAIVSAPPGEKWTIKLIKGQPAKIEYLAVVKSVPYEERRVAEELALQWRRQGFPARAMVRGVQLHAQGRVLKDDRKVMVAVQGFGAPGPCQAFLRQLGKKGHQGFLVEERVAMGSGKLALVDARGNIRAGGTDIRVEPIPYPGLPRFVSFVGPMMSMDAVPHIQVFNVVHDQGLSQAGRETRRYEGGIRATFDAKGRLAVVNVLELESYLQGVLPSEIYATDPPEAIRAQAVAARSKAIAALGDSTNNEPYDICSDQYCQMYRGLERQDGRTTMGVRTTFGEILMDSTGQLVKVNFSDTCGGHSENAENVWSGDPDPNLVGSVDGPAEIKTFPRVFNEQVLAAWLQAKPDSYCKGPADKPNPNFRWLEKKKASEVNKMLNSRLGVGQVKSLVAVSRGVSGRLKELRVVGSKKTVSIKKELNIRNALGGLKSALFVAWPETKGGTIVGWNFLGAGFGHGVGLCQSGARGMALAGKNYRDILGHYLARARCVRMHDANESFLAE